MDKWLRSACPASPEGNLPAMPTLLPFLRAYGVRRVQNRARTHEGPPFPAEPVVAVDAQSRSGVRAVTGSRATELAVRPGRRRLAAPS